VWLALWGLFKKVVIADQLAPYAELAFDHDLRSAPVLLLGTVAFAGQIYGDFSGYSDIARGIARCLGFDLMRNFDRPYAATSLRDFWRRWHISLSTWMRDYLYIPLGGNQGTEARIARNLLLTFVIAGLWHGAAWNFVLWGAWHGLALVVQRRWSLLRVGPLPTPLALHTSLLVWTTPPWTADLALGILPWLLPLVALEFWPGAIPSATTLIRLPHVVRATLAGAAVLAIAAYWERDAVPFLYFQF
jgi:D-alanyl-lipoteichoic acid acyltransferase DltB (MBOAT superfamily)